MSLLEPGPLLSDLLSAYDVERSVLEPAQLARYARALNQRCAELGEPMIWPVGVPAERLAGAAAVLSSARTGVWDRHSRVDGCAVLIVAVADLTGLAVSEAARHAACLGASEVHACGVSVDGIGIGEVRSFQDLSQLTARPRIA